mmetsp:Transcript_13490/g.21017  ORF Transcript_13490/g.21017 Transcript_13490/m.21017 type:complete len:286 (+) Transcript_13490:2606-3463(+)
MSINWANVEESQLLKECSTSDYSTSILVNTLVDILHVLGKQTVETLGKITEILEGLGYQQVGSIGTQLTCWFDTSCTLCSSRKTDLTIIIQNHNHTRAQVSRIVHGLVGHTTGDGSVTNHCNTIILSFVEGGLGHRHALRGTDGCGGVSSTEGIIFGFLTFAKSRHTIELTQRRESITTASEHFVGVALMSNVPDDVILGHIEDVVESSCKFNNTERGGEVTTSFRDSLDDLPTELVGKLLELRHVKAIHVAGEFDRIKDRFASGARVGWSAICLCVKKASTCFL